VKLFSRSIIGVPKGLFGSQRGPVLASDPLLLPPLLLPLAPLDPPLDPLLPPLLLAAPSGESVAAVPPSSPQLRTKTTAPIDTTPAKRKRMGSILES